MSDAGTGAGATSLGAGAGAGSRAAPGTSETLCIPSGKLTTKSISGEFASAIIGTFADAYRNPKPSDSFLQQLQQNTPDPDPNLRVLLSKNLPAVALPDGVYLAVGNLSLAALPKYQEKVHPIPESAPAFKKWKTSGPQPQPPASCFGLRTLTAKNIENTEGKNKDVPFLQGRDKLCAYYYTRQEHGIETTNIQVGLFLVYRVPVIANPGRSRKRKSSSEDKHEGDLKKAAEEAVEAIEAESSFGHFSDEDAKDLPKCEAILKQIRDKMNEVAQNTLDPEERKAYKRGAQEMSNGIFQPSDDAEKVWRGIAGPTSTWSERFDEYMKAASNAPNAASRKQYMMRISTLCSEVLPRHEELLTFDNSRVLLVSVPMQQLDLAEEAELIREAAPGIQLDVLPNPTLAEFKRKLVPTRGKDGVPANQQFSVIQFSGHAQTSETGFNLVFKCHSHGSTNLASVKGVARVVADYAKHFQSPGLQCVVLNACSTESQGKELIKMRIIPYVVCTTGRIENRLATHYSGALYHYISKGFNIPDAHEEAIKELKQECEHKRNFELDGGDQIHLLTTKAEAIETYDFTKLPNYMRGREDYYQAHYAKERSRTNTAALSPPPKLKMRSFQQEMFDFAVAEDRAIVCLPTGAGKTLIAAKVLEHHAMLTSNWEKTCVVLCEGIPLVFQQAGVFEEQTQLRVGRYCGEINVFSWEHEFAANHVLVFTSGLFVNLLKKQHVQLRNIALIVFDEAHHTVKNHPFNEIMKDW
jgi:hypothetical protein